MPTKLMQKSQILLIITFSLLFAGFLVFILTNPILANLKALRESSDSYQAFINAESSLEILYYDYINEIKEINTTSDLLSDLTNCSFQSGRHHSGQVGQVRRVGQVKQRGVNCDVSSHIKFDFNLATSTRALGGSCYIFQKFESLGKYGKYERALFGDFNTGATTTCQ